MSSLIGQTLGQYEVLQLLGRGGMATVYLGRQTSIDRLVAIKVLPPHPTVDEAFKERFQLEARTIGGLQNPHILPLYDYGTQGDILYLVMAYVEGGTLADRLESGALELSEAERILRSVANGLEYAHKRGVIHRDIKPGNILLGEDNHPMLADFGMVKMTSSSTNLTGTAIVGTPAYMAPEQGQGMTIDHRVDVYALGVMLYEMVSGQTPYTGTSPMQIILQHINDPIPDVRDVNPALPADVADVLRVALAKDPDKRYSSAAALAEAFSKALHKNADSLTLIQKQYPVQADVSDEELATVVGKARIPDTSPGAGGGQIPTQPAIIVRDSTNPMILLAGFGLIAVAIVVVTVLLLNAQNNNPAPVIATDSVQITEAATSAAVAAEATGLSTEPAAALPTDAPTAIPEADFGEVRFSSENTLGDRLEMRVRDLRPAPEGTTYAAWLSNTTTGETQLIGTVVRDSFGEGTLIYTDPDGRTLPAVYNAVLITAESGEPETPQGDILYSGSLPAALTGALNAIFVTAEDGFNGGSLLDGARTEAGFAAQHAGLAANARNIGGVRNHAEHTINILRGTEDDYDGNERGSNPGRKVGVYFFLDEIDALLLEATNNAGDVDLQINAEFIRVCTQNVRRWSDEIVELELVMIAAETVEEADDEAQRSTVLTEQLLTGNDVNGDGLVEPFEGECGLNQIPEYGLQVSRMTLREGDVR